MNDFNSGWWACFISFCYQTNCGDICKYVAIDAGVTPTEIEKFLENKNLSFFNEEVEKFLKYELTDYLKKTDLLR